MPALGFNFQPLSNRYVGNTLELEDRLLTQAEGRYKEGEAYNEQYMKMSKAAQALDFGKGILTPDQLRVEELKRKAIKNVEGFAKQGDYENLSHKIKSEAENFATQYAPYAQNMKLYQEQVKEFKKDNKWDDATQNAWLQMQQESYIKNGGLKVDPVTGLASGYINVNSMIDYKNVEEGLANIMSKMKAKEFTYEDDKLKTVYNDDGSISLYDKLTQTTGKKLTENELRKFGMKFLAGSPEYSGVLQTKAIADAYSSSKQLKSDGTTGLSNIAKNINKGIDNDILKYENDLLTLKKDPKKNAKYIDDYNIAINNLKNSKIDNKDYENLNKVSNKLYNEYIDNAVTNVADLLDEDSRKVTNTLYKNEGRAKLALDAADEKIANTQTMIHTALNKDNIAEVGNSYLELSKNLKLAQKAYNGSLLAASQIRDLKGKSLVTSNTDEFKELNKLNFNNLSQKDLEQIRDTFIKKGFVVTTDWVQNNLANFQSIKNTKQAVDEINYNLDRYKRVGNAIITPDIIAAYRKEAKDNKSSDEDIQGMLMTFKPEGVKETLSMMLPSFGLDFEADTRKAVSMKNEFVKKFYNTHLKTKLNNINDYTDFQYAITNADEKSTIGKFKNQITASLVAAEENLTSNGVSLETLKKQSHIFEGETDARKAENGLHIVSIDMLTDGQVMATLQDGKDGAKTKLPIDLNEKSGNAKEAYLKSIKTLITNDNNKVKENEGSATGKVVQQGLITFGKMSLDKKDNISLYNLQNGDKEVIKTNSGTTYQITKSGNFYELKNAEGKIIEAGGKYLFVTFDDLMEKIGTYEATKFN